MDPVMILGLFNALVDGAERLAPIISDLGKKGLITPEEQAAALARIESLRNESFSGPEWQIRP